MGERPALTNTASDMRTSQQGIHIDKAGVSLTKGEGSELCLHLYAEIRQAEGEEPSNTYPWTLPVHGHTEYTVFCYVQYFKNRHKENGL